MTRLLHYGMAVLTISLVFTGSALCQNWTCDNLTVRNKATVKELYAGGIHVVDNISDLWAENNKQWDNIWDLWAENNKQWDNIWDLWAENSKQGDRISDLEADFNKLQMNFCNKVLDCLEDNDDFCDIASDCFGGRGLDQQGNGTASLSGEAQLTDGECTVNLSEQFLDGITIDDDNPMRVLVSPTADCNGIYVAEKTSDSFTVRELGGGSSGATFDWQVIARTK